MDVVEEPAVPLASVAGGVVFIALNWLTYHWAVNAGHVAEVSLGYSLNPLLNVVLGMIVFGERPARQSLLGIGFAAIGVAVKPMPSRD